MTVSAAVLVGAAVAAVVLPRALERLRSVGVSPSALIAAWLLSIAGVLLAAVAGVVLLFIPSHGVPHTAITLTSLCRTGLCHGAPPHAEELTGVAGSVALTIMATRLALVGRRTSATRRRSRSEHLAVLRLAGRTEPGTPDILWLPHDRPLAFALLGRPSYLVATDGLHRHLDADAVAAVLEHERAHVRGRHGLWTGVARVVGEALPFVPLCRAAPAALRELTELAADAAAARRLGRDVVRIALLRVTCGSGTDLPDVTCGALDLRLEQLADGHRSSWPVRGLARFALAGAPALPFAMATIVLVSSMAVFCWPSDSVGTPPRLLQHRHQLPGIGATVQDPARPPDPEACPAESPGPS